MAEWLLDETKPLDDSATASISTTLLRMKDAAVRGRAKGETSLALRMNDLVVYDTKKLFGGADIRVDAIVVTGSSPESASFYQPNTIRFPDVRDGDRLPIEAPGLIFFYGRPSHFLDVSIMVSRDRKDTKDLAKLIVDHVESAKWKAAAGALLGLAIAAPQAAAVTTAIGAAVTLGNFAFEVLSQVTGATIGLYRTSWLQERDRFGLGRHPQSGSYRQRDLEFWYEIVVDRRQRTADAVTG